MTFIQGFNNYLILLYLRDCQSLFGSIAVTLHKVVLISSTIFWLKSELQI